MADTPSWLQASNDAPAPAPAPSASAPVGSMNLETSAVAGGTNATTSTADEKDLPSVILMMRLMNMGVAGALIAISVSGETTTLDECTFEIANLDPVLSNCCLNTTCASTALVSSGCADDWNTAGFHLCVGDLR
jgi:hypothetical protein